MQGFLGQGVTRPHGAPCRVAFAAPSDLWVMPVGGAPRRLIADQPYEVADPAWSPDGRKIAYADDREGSFDHWVYDLASG